ncbi:MAG TPA: GspE/PulE family protein [Planctomycetota bacterium]|nr:GspE/PulE family protein [Planctomycetota bacterium]
MPDQEFTELSQYETQSASAGLLPLEFCREHRVAVLGPPDAAPLTVGTVDPLDGELLAEISRRVGRPVAPVQLNDFEVRRALSAIYGLPLGDEEGGSSKLSSAREIGFYPDQTPRKLLEDLLAVAIRRRATDVHLESYNRDVDLRFRIDGVLHQVSTPISPDNLGRVLSRLKVLCELDLAERRRAQDGRFSVQFEEDGETRRVDVRVTILPGLYGQDVAMRILDPKRFILDLERTEMSPALGERYRRLIRYPHGLILATGPTGAGKTTTLYATVRELHSDHLKIVTVEDPVEYEFPKVNQKNVTAAMGFADHLRAFLRSNPDIMLVGEIRDAETAEIAIRAATTGHLILSTLHTRDSIAAVARLRALGVPNDYLSEVLIGVLGQRLVRRLCTGCRLLEVPPEPLIRLYFQKPPDHGFWRGAGCDLCGGTGYLGLVGVFELLQPNEEVASAIGRGIPVEEIRKVARANGWTPLVEDALAKVGSGVTSLEEVARRIPPKFPLGL